MSHQNKRNKFQPMIIIINEAISHEELLYVTEINI